MVENEKDEREKTLKRFADMGDDVGWWLEEPRVGDDGSEPVA